MWVVLTPKTRRALRSEEETLHFPLSSREPFLTEAYYIVVVEYVIRPERLCSIPHQHNRIISIFLHFGPFVHMSSPQARRTSSWSSPWMTGAQVLCFEYSPHIHLSACSRLSNAPYSAHCSARQTQRNNGFWYGALMSLLITADRPKSTIRTVFSRVTMTLPG
jgi:hypothetical protein